MELRVNDYCLVSNKKKRELLKKLAGIAGMEYHEFSDYAVVEESSNGLIINGYLKPPIEARRLSVTEFALGLINELEKDCEFALINELGIDCEVEDVDNQLSFE